MRGNMLRCAVVGLMIVAVTVQHVFVGNAAAEEARVNQMSFCKARGAVKPTCEQPIIKVGDVLRVSIDELQTDGNNRPIVWVWSSSTTPADIKIGYLFIQEKTGKQWSKTIHVHWIDSSANLLSDLHHVVRDALAIVHQDNYKFTQLSAFMARPRNRNRWPASFVIEEPGRFHLSIVKLGSELDVVPGGERMTLLVEQNDEASRAMRQIEEGEVKAPLLKKGIPAFAQKGPADVLPQYAPILVGSVVFPEP